MSEKAKQAKDYGVTGDGEFEHALRKYRALRDAVSALYYSAVWHADRPVQEDELWVAVRDAAGLPSGNSPEELPYPGVRLKFPVSKFRLMGGTIRKGEFSTAQAEAFLSLYQGEFEERMNQAVREFLEEKLG